MERSNLNLILAIEMPVLAQYIVYAAVVIGALAVIWKKVLRPSAKLITTTEEMLPLLRQLTEEFRNTPHAFAVLDEIVAQFRTDSGSSLRDAVDRLDKAAVDNREVANTLAIGVEAARLLAIQDREQLQRLIILLDRLTLRVDAGTATTLRIEKHASDVAADLSAAHKRADEVVGSEHGAAADAAAKQTAKEKREELG